LSVPGFPLISLVVPVFEDFDAAAGLLAGICPDPRLELIVADGGGDRRLDRLASTRADLHIVNSARGRAVQMNAGAATARGEWLLFLHADSRLPQGWIEAIARAPADIVGGWFAFALDDDAWQARVIERGVGLRVRLLRLPYGDQGLFVRRTVFEAMAGYRELPLMEDVEIVRRLVRSGPTLALEDRLVTSARRWRRDGWLRRSARNVILLTLYFLGVSPVTLARRYDGPPRR
jgi:rSAM/selenodomain-associated transferase 2